MTPWYAAAVSGTRNVLLLIDISSPQNLALHKKLAHGVMDTLSTNDFVAIYTYGGSGVERVGGSTCQTTALNRASKWFLKKARSSIEALTAQEGSPDLQGALDRGFSLTKSDDCLGRSALVNIQAGKASGNIGDIIAEKGRDWRVFTYSSTKGNVDYLDSICVSNGWYQELSGSWQEKVLAVATYYDKLLSGAPERTDETSARTSFIYGSGLRTRSYDGTTIGDILTLSRAVWYGEKFIGVIGVDIRMWQLKDTMDSIKLGDSLPILYTANGETLYHPVQSLYKTPYLVKTGYDISDYEGFQGSTFDTMVRPYIFSGTGKRTISIPRPIPKGDTARVGIDTRTIVTHYSWAPIPMSPYFLMFAFAEHDLLHIEQFPDKEGYDVYMMDNHVALNDGPLNKADFASKGISYNVRNQNNCKNSTGHTVPGCIPHSLGYQVGAIAFEYGINAFSPSCHENPTDARDSSYTERMAMGLRHFLNDESNSTNTGHPPILLVCKREAQKLRMYQNWTLTANHEQTVWLYYGTELGTSYVYPSNNWGSEYDPTFRPWYFRSVASDTTLSFSTPYIDAGGAGLVSSVMYKIKVNTKGKNGNASFPIDDRVQGVIGYDFVFPAFINQTAQLANCSLKRVQLAVASDPEPMCFFIDKSGMLATHSDFLVSFTEIESYPEYTGTNLGSWPIENVFIGEKEPPLATALMDAGVLVRKSSLNEDKSQMLHFFSLEDTKLTNGVWRGSSLTQTADCAWKGIINLVLVPETNIYLVHVEGYERGNISSCPPVKAYDLESYEVRTCAAVAEKGSMSCIGRSRSTSLELEDIRPTEGSCKIFNWVKYTDSAGILAVSLGVIGLVIILVISFYLFWYGGRYVLKISVPTMNYLMCTGGGVLMLYIITLPGESTDSLCRGRLFLSLFGFVLLYMSIVAREVRVLILSNENAKVNSTQLFGLVLGMVAFMFIIFAVVAGSGDLKAINVQSKDDKLKYDVECHTNDDILYRGLIYTLQMIILATGCVLGLLTRNVTLKEFQENKQISLAIYNVTIIFLIVIPMHEAMDLNNDGKIILQTLSNFFAVIASLLLIFLPKLQNLHLRSEDFDFAYRARKGAKARSRRSGTKSDPNLEIRCNSKSGKKDKSLVVSQTNLNSSQVLSPISPKDPINLTQIQKHSQSKVQLVAKDSKGAGLSQINEARKESRSVAV
ncbi:hypothetical protein AAMO2058_001087600 [Amorphochlora amoebiformis]